MQVTISNESPITIKAEVVVPWDQVASAYKATLKKVGGGVHIPGFRPGKAPAAVIKKKYHHQIVSELANTVVPTTMSKWLEEKGIKAVGTPRLADMDMKEKESFAYTVQVDILPEVELKDWKGLKAETLDVVVDEEQVNQRLEQMREHAVERNKITDRGAQDGDKVNIQLTVIDTQAGETLTDLDSYNVHLGAEGAHPVLSKLIAGMQVEETKTEETVGAEDDHFESWRGKSIRIMLEVLDVVQEVLPELDDEFAKKFEAESVDALRAKTQKAMLESAKEGEKMRLNQELLKQHMEAYDFEVPAELVQHTAYQQVEMQLQPYMHMLGPKGPDRQLVGEMMRMAMPQAMFKVRADLVLDKLAEVENIEVSDAAIMAELEKILPHTREKSVTALKDRMVNEGTILNVEEMIKRDRALGLIRDAAELTTVAELTQTEEAHDHHHHEHGEHCNHDHDHDHDHDHHADADDSEVIQPEIVT